MEFFRPDTGTAKGSSTTIQLQFLDKLPTIFILGKWDSALAPSHIVGIGVFPLAVESSAIGVLRRQCFLLVFLL